MKCLILVFVLIGVSTGFSQQPIDPNAAFWGSLKTLCGKAFAGTVVAAPPGDTTFKNKDIVMRAFHCQPQKMKIRLAVGEDRSRTWILYQWGDKLLLKHDHRKADGTPDGATNYGGWTSNPGSATRQVFPADSETYRNIPEAAANIWWIDLVAGDHFTYNLQRIGTDRRYSLKFDLTKPVPFLLEN